MKNKLLLLTLVIASLFCLVGCVEEKDSTGETVIADATAAKKEAVTTAAKSFATVGQSVTGNTWKITLTSVNQYTEAGDSDFIKSEAEDGNVFVVMFFEVENVSAEDNFFNSFNVKGYVDDYSTELTYLLTDIEKNSLLSGDVAAGKKLKGYIAFEVSSNWNELEMSYDDGVFSSNVACQFKVTRDQVTKVN